MKFIFALIVEFLADSLFAALWEAFLDLLIGVPRRSEKGRNDLPNYYAIQTGPSTDDWEIFTDDQV